jgi:hypothetical protein
VDLSIEPTEWQRVSPETVETRALAVVNSTARLRPGRASHALAVVELRQYTLRPGRRDALVGLFEEHLIEPQEQVGMAVIGQFEDRDFPDRFVWVRGFPDMHARRASLASFYDGPVWKEHRDAANATMLDSDDVLLLRPARLGVEFELDRERPPVGADPGERGAVAAAIGYLDGDQAEAVAVRVFESAVAPAIAAAGGSVLGYFVTEPSTNDFPRLPVREGERVLVWFAGFSDLSALDDAMGPIRATVRAALGRLRPIRRIEYLRLTPTARSLLTGRSAGCRAVADEASRAPRSRRREAVS